MQNQSYLQECGRRSFSCTDEHHVARSSKTVLSEQHAVATAIWMQADAERQMSRIAKVVSTDPPYYDNIGYADLSDFFYVWLRRSLKPVFPDLFATLAVPKADELVATPYRHGSKGEAETFFLDGMTGNAPTIGAGAPWIPGHHLLRVQAIREQGRFGDYKHRMGDLPRRIDARRFQHYRHLADTHRSNPRASEPSNRTPSHPASSSFVGAVPSMPRPRRAVSSWLPSSRSCQRHCACCNPATLPRSTSPRPPSAPAWRYTPATRGCSSRATAVARTRGQADRWRYQHRRLAILHDFGREAAEPRRHHPDGAPARRRTRTRRDHPGSTTCFRSMPASGGCGPSEITKRLPLPTRLGVWRIEAQSRYYNRAIHRGAAAERSPREGGWSMRSRVIAGYSWAEVQALRDAGFMGITIPEAHGGQGRGFLDTALAVDKMMQALGEANSTRSSISMDTSPITLHEREHDQNRPRP